MRAIVFHDRPGDRYRAGRTLRALRAAGVESTEAVDGMAEMLRAWRGDLWLVRAGAWPLTAPAAPPASGSGRPLCAVGAGHVLAEGDVPVLTGEWAELLMACGGDLQACAGRLPAPESVYLDAVLVEALRGMPAGGGAIRNLIDAAVRGRGGRGGQEARVVRWRALDIVDDERLRVAQVITSLQIGGAERVVLDLAHCLPRVGRFGVSAPLITTGRPTREAYAQPPGAVDVSGAEGGREGRMAAAAQAALALHVDAVHVHLLTAWDVEAFRAAGLPVVMTLHNLRQGWAGGVEELRAADAELLVACANRVEHEARDAGLEVPVRTAWNGIDGRALGWTPTLGKAARALRASWGAEEGDWVLLALANPRPQKRLELLPEILKAVESRLRATGERRRVFVVIAGEAACGLAEARLAEELLEGEIRRHGLEDRVLRIGAVREVAPLLHAADALVSVSAWEGLSLAQLEAVAAGLPVVATAVGGTAELGAMLPTVRLVPAEMSADAFAHAVVETIERRSRPAPVLPGHFRRDRMAERYAQLFPRAIERARGRREGRGVWLVTNNFSTGGAQSSARRLLLALRERGYDVRAAVVQEEVDHPTPGRQALETAGIRVLAVPPPAPLGENDPAVAVAELLEAIDGDRPEAVVFWNLITQYKVLLADLLLDVPVFEVSPGEMNFSSLAKYFASPRPGLPYRSAAEYGRRLAGSIVKFEGERAVAAGLGAPVHVIPNGVCVPRHIPVRRARGDVLRLGTSARLSPQKKLEELFAALRAVRGEMPPYVLRIAGGVDGENGAYVRTLQEGAKDLPVEWLGEVRDIPAFLADLDLFVMISEPAGCPNASLEAMAAGLPVIATKVGGAAEQVVDGATGRIVPPADPEALGRAIAEAAHDPAMLRQWGVAGWERARERFSVERMAADYARVLFANSPVKAPAEDSTPLPAMSL